MTQRLNQSVSENARDFSRRMRLASTCESHLGKSLRRAFKADTENSIPPDFSDLLGKLA